MLIGENYKIESDSLNVTLYHKTIPKKTGKVRWREVAYFSSPQNALDYLVKQGVMETGMTDLQTVYDKIAELERLIRTLEGLPALV